MCTGESESSNQSSNEESQVIERVSYQTNAMLTSVNENLQQNINKAAALNRVGGTAAEHDVLREQRAYLQGEQGAYQSALEQMEYEHIQELLNQAQTLDNEGITGKYNDGRLAGLQNVLRSFM